MKDFMGWLREGVEDEFRARARRSRDTIKHWFGLIQQNGTHDYALKSAGKGHYFFQPYHMDGHEDHKNLLVFVCPKESRFCQGISGGQGAVRDHPLFGGADVITLCTKIPAAELMARMKKQLPDLFKNRMAETYIEEFVHLLDKRAGNVKKYGDDPHADLAAYYNDPFEIRGHLNRWMSWWEDMVPALAKDDYFGTLSRQKILGSEEGFTKLFLNVAGQQDPDFLKYASADTMAELEQYSKDAYHYLLRAVEQLRGVTPEGTASQ